MDRRTFLQITAVSAVAVSIPMVHCNPAPNGLLEFPGTLSSICDEKTIREIGQAYLAQYPADNSKSRLEELLLEGYQGKGKEDTDAIASLLDKKIHTDFSKSQTTILKGWVLSLTEARQCALFSLTKA